MDDRDLLIQNLRREIERLRVSANWVQVSMNDVTTWVCSCCDLESDESPTDMRPSYKFCPRCGAKMKNPR